MYAQQIYKENVQQLLIISTMKLEHTVSFNFITTSFKQWQHHNQVEGFIIYTFINDKFKSKQFKYMYIYVENILDMLWIKINKY